MTETMYLMIAVGAFLSETKRGHWLNALLSGLLWPLAVGWALAEYCAARDKKSDADTGDES